MKLFKFKFHVFLLSLLIIISTFSSNNSFAKCSIQIENFKIKLEKQKKDLNQKLENIKKLPSNKKDIQIKKFHSLLDKYRTTILKKIFTSCSEDQKTKIKLLEIGGRIKIVLMQKKIQEIEIALMQKSSTKLQKQAKEILNKFKKMGIKEKLKKIKEKLEK